MFGWGAHLTPIYWAEQMNTEAFLGIIADSHRYILQATGLLRMAACYCDRKARCLFFGKDYKPATFNLESRAARLLCFLES